MKLIKLRKCNSQRYCPNCRKIVNIVMVGLDGFCPKEVNMNGDYLNKLYTIDNRDKKNRNKKNG